MAKTTVIGVSDLRAALEKARDQALAACERAVADETMSVRDDMRRTAPVETGELRGSMTARSSGLRGEAGAMARHARYVEFGTNDTPAQPFALPASEVARHRFPRRVISEVRRAVE